MRCTFFFRWLLVAILAGFLASCASEPRVVSVHSYYPPEAPAQIYPPVARGHYRVRRGDTLYSIAFRHDMDYRDLARINHINTPYTIYPGQVLSLPTQPGFKRSTTLPAHSPTVVHRRRSSRPASVAPTPPVARAGAGSVQVHAPVPVSPNMSAALGPGRSKDGIVWYWPLRGPILSAFRTHDPGRQGIDIAGKMGEPVHAVASGVVVYSGSGLIGYGELVIVKHSDTYLSAYGHNRVRLVKEGDRVKAGQVIAEMGSSGASRVELHFEIRRNGKAVNPLNYLPQR
ncbi:MAG TPA: LysM peptidoglycan-binding domain-containing protein [Mizugakiibacter sp.]|nr:LysM peptidoglycan-binding domain-containing protein [Mizugakiibacter sp.]